MLEEHMPTIENVLSPFLKEREDVAKVVKLKDQIKDFDKLVETAHESFVWLWMEMDKLNLKVMELRSHNNTTETLRVALVE